MPDSPVTPPASGTWKRRLGLGLLVYSFVPLCTVGLLAFLDVPPAAAVTYSAVYLASGEIAFLAAVALLGKAFVTAVKDKIKAFFRTTGKPATPRPISRARHAMGVSLFALSIVPYYAALGFLLLARITSADVPLLLGLLLSGEGLFLVSLFVLGEEFWARLKRLFEWPGKLPSEGNGV
mgnify:CR=1 FL=1